MYDCFAGAWARLLLVSTVVVCRPWDVSWRCEQHVELFFGQVLIRALPCAASCCCAYRYRFMSGEAPGSHVVL